MALGVSEKEAAVFFQRTVRTYRKIEANEASPGGYDLLQFVERHNISLEWLVGGELPSECAGLSPTRAVIKMAGHVTH